jgi:quinoprotein glucose dehydrogenase
MAGIAAVLVIPAVLLATRSDLAARIREVGVQRAASKAWNRVRHDGLVATLKAVTGKSPAAFPSDALPLRYPLSDPGSTPPIEDSAARASLPEFVDVPAASLAELAPSVESTRTHTSWHRSGADEMSTKFSSLDQIRAENVHLLEPAWSYTSGSDLGDSTKTGGLTVETNPIVVGDRMFLSTIDGDLVSLDASTGKEIWRLALPAPVARRGLLWEPNPDFAKSRLFVPSGKGVFAVNAATGTVLKEFGNAGAVGSGVSVIAPVIVADRLVIATLAPALEAYDLATGRMSWRRSLLEPLDSAGARLSGGAPWGGMSADVRRGTVFVSTGNPRPALVGTTRPGKNRFSCSVVAVDAASGTVRWSFQEVEHDLWDLDLPSAPILTTITRSGRRIDVVAVLTKRGNTVLLDRDQGRSIFGYRLRRAPVSSIPGEQTAAYQPVFDLPEPFSTQEFTADQITDLSESATRTVTRKLRGATFGFFAPPQIGGKVALYGLHGGAEWPGGAVDPTRGILYVPSNRMPWLIRAQYVDVKASAATGVDVPGHSLYRAKCAQCHGESRQGSYEWEGAGDAYHPALTGITFLRKRELLESAASFAAQHEGAKVASAVTADELKLLYGYFATLDQQGEARRSFVLSAFWQLLLDDRGNPGNKPPWGLLTAIDLNSGRHLWQVPFGQDDRLRPEGAPVRGLQNMGGVAATAGGLVFATGTTDNKVRAFSTVDGRELWSHQLPAAGSTMPTVYSVNGTQYVVVVATGGVFKGFSGRSDRVIAFRLPASTRMSN